MVSENGTHGPARAAAAKAEEYALVRFDISLFKQGTLEAGTVCVVSDELSFRCLYDGVAGAHHCRRRSGSKRFHPVFGLSKLSLSAAFPGR